MANQDVLYDGLLARIRNETSRLISRFNNMPAAQLDAIGKQAMAKLNALPAGAKNMALDIIQREEARGLSARGLGWVGTASSIATIVATAGQVGLSIYGVTEQRKAQKEADSRANAQLAIDNQLAMEQLKSIQQARELQAKQAAQEMAARQAEIDAANALAQRQQEQQKLIEQGVIAPPAGSPAAPSSNKNLLIMGGVAAAGIAAVTLMK